MEGKGAATLGSGLDTIRAVMTALENAGIEFLNHGQPGVRLNPRKKAKPSDDAPMKGYTTDPDEADRIE
jgi:hypothetical protein